MGLRAILDYLVPRTPAPAKGAAALMPNFRWAGRGSEVQAGLFHLLDPFVYVYDSRRGGCEEPAAIDLALSVSGVTVPPIGRELPYWPSYHALLPHQRRFYLQWLAGNRSSVPPELGYIFLFFYNLERRALVDRLDIRLIASEVLRLRKLYSASGPQTGGSWEGYSGRFLWILLLAHQESLTLEDIRSHNATTNHWTEDNLAAALGCLLLRGHRLTASFAFSIASFLPQSMRSIVQRRVPGEFEELFKKRFREQFPDGIELKPATAKQRFLYRPASNVLQPFEVSFPNPWGIKSQFKPLSKIWNACIDDLKKLGTLSRQGTEPDAVKRWEALPEALRAGADHPLTDEFCRLIESRSDEHGQTILKIEEMAAVLDPEGAAKLTVGRSRRLSQTAEQIGYFMEPDARLTGRAYRPGEQVVAFLKMSTAPIDPARYGPAACMLQFGFLAAASDGQADERELEVIARHIESAFELQEDEVRRMARLRALLQRTGPDRALLRRLVRGLAKLQRQAIAKLLVAIVLADGVVTSAERKALQGACALLSVDFSEIEALLPHEISDEPVTVRPGTTGAPGERLPTPPEQAFVLNRSAIASILAETRDVAQMLAKAMASTEEIEEDVPSASSPVVARTAVSAVTAAVDLAPAASEPPAKYLSLYRALIVQEKWLLADAEASARTYGLMLAGAIDALNEWACDACGGQLFFEDAEYLVVERSLLK